VAEYREISLSLIDLPEHSLGFDERYDNLDELAADIKRNGQLVPIIVNPKGERFELRDGKRRWHALRQAGVMVARCMVHGESDPPSEEVKLKANLLREANTDAEIAAWLCELADVHKKSLPELAAMVGRSEEWVNSRVDLMRGDQEVLLAVAKKEINFSQAREINRCKNPDDRRAVLAYAIHDGLPARRIQEWVQRQAVADGIVAKVQAQPQNGEVVAVDPGPGLLCWYCGGNRDPQNLVDIKIHPWHLELLRALLDKGGPANA
jgi:ParB/RepB/Spo0J family partition protein